MLENLVRNPALFYSGILPLTARLALASGRSLAIPFAQKTTDNFEPGIGRDMAQAAIINIAETVPSAGAEIVEISKVSKALTKDMGLAEATTARIPVSWTKQSMTRYAAVAFAKNAPMNYAFVRALNRSNSESGSKETDTSTATSRVLQAGVEGLISGATSGALFQEQMNYAARGWTFSEMARRALTTFSTPETALRTACVATSKGGAIASIFVPLAIVSEAYRSHTGQTR